MSEFPALKKTKLCAEFWILEFRVPDCAEFLAWLNYAKNKIREKAIYIAKHIVFIEIKLNLFFHLFSLCYT